MKISTTKRLRAVSCGLLAWSSLFVHADERAVTALAVSPGEGQAAGTAIATTCPSFSWSTVAGAVGYELAVFDGQWNDNPDYAVQRNQGIPLRQFDIPAPALSYTPAGDDCLDEGGSYLWFVRALTAAGEGLWSPARYFEIDYDADALTQTVRREVAARLGQPGAWRDLIQEVLESKTRSGTQNFAANLLPTATTTSVKAATARASRTSPSARLGVGVQAAATFNPTALRVSSAKGIVFDDPVGGGGIPAEGGGTRFMWYPAKRALRAGYAQDTEWDDAAIGNFSMALGMGTTASGDASIALGEFTTASGRDAMATNFGTLASGDSSLAMGESTIAEGYAATAMGFASEATAWSSTAMGDTTSAVGDAATAMGFNTKAEAYASLVLGQYNIPGGDPFTWVSEDPVMVVGNGTDTTPSNALTLYKNGNLTIAGTLTQASDWAAKENFAAVDPLAILAKVAALPITAWNYKADDPAIRHLGPMAQDFRAAFGLGQDDKGIATVDSDGVALASIQGLYRLLLEQQARLDGQQHDLQRLAAQNGVQQDLILALHEENALLARRLQTQEDAAAGIVALRAEIAALRARWEVPRQP